MAKYIQSFLAPAAPPVSARNKLRILNSLYSSAIHNDNNIIPEHNFISLICIMNINELYCDAPPDQKSSRCEVEAKGCKGVCL